MEHFSFESGCVIRVEILLLVRCVTSYSQRRLRSGCIIHLYSSKRHFGPLILLKRQSALVLKVGVLCGWKIVQYIARED